MRCTIYFSLNEREKLEELDPAVKGNTVREPKNESKTVNLVFLDPLPKILIPDIHNSDTDPGLGAIGLGSYQGSCHSRQGHSYTRHRSGEAEASQGQVRKRPDKWDRI